MEHQRFEIETKTFVNPFAFSGLKSNTKMEGNLESEILDFVPANVFNESSFTRVKNEVKKEAEGSSWNQTSHAEYMINLPCVDPYSKEGLTVGNCGPCDAVYDNLAQPNTNVAGGSPEYSTEPQYQYVQYSPFSDSQSSHSFSESSPGSPGKLEGKPCSQGSERNEFSNIFEYSNISTDYLIFEYEYQKIGLRIYSNIRNINKSGDEYIRIFGNFPRIFEYSNI